MHVKNMKKPSQPYRGVLVGPKVGFQPIKQGYRQVSKKNNVSVRGNKKKDAEPITEVSMSNSFDVLNLVENDFKLGTNGGTSNLASKKANLSDHDIEEEVTAVDNDMENVLASKDVGYGQDLSNKIQDICDNLDIKVRSRKKK
nr:hypothetical protein [Tanacetum cinerariifolium]